MTSLCASTEAHRPSSSNDCGETMDNLKICMWDHFREKGPNACFSNSLDV